MMKKIIIFICLIIVGVFSYLYFINVNRIDSGITSDGSTQVYKNTHYGFSVQAPKIEIVKSYLPSNVDINLSLGTTTIKFVRVSGGVLSLDKDNPLLYQEYITEVKKNKSQGEKFESIIIDGKQALKITTESCRPVGYCSGVGDTVIFIPAKDNKDIIQIHYQLTTTPPALVDMILKSFKFI